MDAHPYRTSKRVEPLRWRLLHRRVARWLRIHRFAIFVLAVLAMLFAMVRSEIERKFVDWSEQRASYFRHPAIDTCAGNIRAHVGIELCMEFSLADVRSYAPDSSF